ncbi:MAG: hypothetical protein K8S56_02450 [Candidatus Cloacimonetes bacterium]|nr:hypothetical protein [Candidatus Cloacimonadota bacterium]
MKKTTLLIMAFILLSSMFAIDNPLWNKAKEMQKKSHNLVPGIQKNTTIIMNKKREVQRTTEVIVKYEIEGNDFSASVVSALRNGEPIDEDDSEVKSLLTQPPDDSEDDSTFFDKVTSIEEISSEISDGKDCICFEYVSDTNDKKGKPKKEIGKIWIEKETGIPTTREFVVEPLPKKVKKMKITISYNLTDSKELVVSKIESNITIKVMLMTFIMSSTQEMSNYFPKL